MEESKEEQEHLRLFITCPNCDKKNSIKLQSKTKCGNCKESLTQWEYNKFKKPMIGAFSAFLIGGVSIYNIDNYFDKRYPMSVEYSIIDSCIRSDEEPLYRSYIRQKKDVCVCALSKTTNDFDYSDYKDSEDRFLIIFEKKAEECQ